MHWNERGEFSHKGQVIKGSNIVDLVNDIVRHRKDFHPHGWQEFARALRRGNVLQDLIGNQRRWDWMHRESTTLTKSGVRSNQTGTSTSEREEMGIPIINKFLRDGFHSTMWKREKQLSSTYYDVKGIRRFEGIRSLAKNSKVKTKQAKAWLSSQDSYTLHKPIRYKFPRRKTIVAGPNQQWQADLIDVSGLSRHNRGTNTLLTCINMFSKKAWVVPLNDKMGTSLVNAFESICHPFVKCCRRTRARNSSIANFNIC